MDKLRFIINVLFALFPIGIIVSIIFPESALSGIIFSGTNYICHGGDSIILGGREIVPPLCFRCLGIYTFLFIGSAYCELTAMRTKKKYSYLFFISFTLPIILDGITGFSRDNHFEILTFLTGALFGSVCGVVINQGLRN